MSLKEYRRKRNFQKTPEPAGEDRLDRGPLRFVVQKHAASRLHYDFRIEWEGSFKSWAVPKGPSLNPMDQRLAVFVEDHPLDYGSFEGIIPSGNYGAGTVLLWDAGTVIERRSRGRHDSEEALAKGFAKGHLTFVLHGQKLKGEFALIKIGKGDPKAWLLVKKRDRFSASKGDVLAQEASVKTGRSLAEIAAEAADQGEVWLPGKGAERPVVPFPFDESLPVSQPESSGSVVPPGAAPDPGVAPDFEDLPLESFPRQLGRLQAKRFSAPFDQSGWWFAPDFGGLPIRCERESSGVRLITRGDLKKRFPDLEQKLKVLPPGIFEGELLVESADGLKKPTKSQPPTHFYVSDVLHVNGKNTRQLAAAHRHALLVSLLPQTDGIALKAWRPDSGTTAFDEALAVGAVGILAIDGSAPYQAGVQTSFLKIEADRDEQGVGSVLPPLLPELLVDASTRPLHLPKALDPVKSGERIGARGPVFTNLEKIYWPAEKLTKGDLVAYYRLVSEAILPHLTDRPLSLNRHPDGIEGENFFHKNMTGYFPAWFVTEPVASRSSGKSINYAICQNEASLLYLANFGCIELNPWFSRLGNIDHPDFIAIDLDPDRTTFPQVLEVALSIHTLLTELDLRHCVKTSGSSGLHICIPLDGETSYDDGRTFSEDLCHLIAHQHPETTSVERSPSKRRRRMYLDYMQNRRSQTLASVYSVRPRPGATVSTPVTWDEVRAGFRMQDFTIKTLPARLDRVGDLWAPMLLPGQSLDEAWKVLKTRLSKFPR